MTSVGTKPVSSSSASPHDRDAKPATRLETWRAAASVAFDPATVLGLTTAMMRSLLRGPGDDGPSTGARAVPDRPRGPGGTGLQLPHLGPGGPPPGGFSAVRAGGALALRPVGHPLAVGAGIAVEAARPQLQSLLTAGYRAVEAGISRMENVAAATERALGAGGEPRDDGGGREPRLRMDRDLGPVDLSRAEDAFNAELNNGSPESLRLLRERRPDQIEGHFMQVARAGHQALDATRDANPARYERWLGVLRNDPKYVPRDVRFSVIDTADGGLRIQLR